MLAAVATLIAALGGLYFNAQSVRQATQQLRLADRAQASERFSRSVEQLGSDDLPVRVGAVHAFGGLMRDSPTDQQSIVEILSSFVLLRAREAGRSGGPESGDPRDYQQPSAPRDLVAAIGVLSRQPRTESGASQHAGEPVWRSMYLERIRLTGLRLDGVAMRDAGMRSAQMSRVVMLQADLSGADLSGATLASAVLTGSTVAGADLRRANLRSATLAEVDLSGSRLQDALLRGAWAWRARLDEADLQRGALQRVDLEDSSMISADLEGANLAGASLVDVDLSGADLSGANLQGADLTGADLTNATLRDVYCDARTRWPGPAPGCNRRPWRGDLGGD